MTIINEGRLKKTNDIYQVKLLNINNLADIIELQNVVYNNLVDKTKLERLSEDEFNFILTNNGMMIGVYVDNHLIAARALLVPKDDPDHLGLAIGLKEEEIDKVIYQEVSFVHPDFQGNGLQKIMGNLIMEELNNKKHPYLYVCATVAPDNIPSLKDKFNQQLEIRAFRTIYGEKQRYVFAKELDKLEGNRRILKEELIKINETNKIKDYLDLKWVGQALITKNEQYYIKLVLYK